MKASKLLDRPIAFHRCFAELGGSVNAGLMLSQAVYWSQRTKNGDGWFWKTAEEWQEETYLTRTEQATARKQLKRLACWQEELRGVPAKLFYRVDFDALDELLSADKPARISQSSLPESANPVCTIPENKPSASVQTFITETTTEITPETTHRGGAVAVIPADPKPARPLPPSGGSAGEIAREYFPQLGIWQQDLIENADINHMIIWRQCCERWRDNRYSLRNITGLIDSYYKHEAQHANSTRRNDNGQNRRESHNERAARETRELIEQLTGQTGRDGGSDSENPIFELPPAFRG